MFTAATLGVVSAIRQRSSRAQVRLGVPLQVGLVTAVALQAVV